MKNTKWYNSAEMFGLVSAIFAMLMIITWATGENPITFLLSRLL